MGFAKVDEYGRRYVEGSDGRRVYIGTRVEQEPQHGPGDVGFTGQPVAAPAPTATAVQEAPAAAPAGITPGQQDLIDRGIVTVEGGAPGGVGVGVTPVTTFQTPGGTTGEVGTVPTADLSFTPANEEQRRKESKFQRRMRGYRALGIPEQEARERPEIAGASVPDLGLAGGALGLAGLPGAIEGAGRTVVNALLDAGQGLSDTIFRDVPEFIGQPIKFDPKTGRAVNPLPSLPRIVPIDGQNYPLEGFVTDMAQLATAIVVTRSATEGSKALGRMAGRKLPGIAGQAVTKAGQGINVAGSKVVGLPAAGARAVSQGLNKAGAKGAAKGVQHVERILGSSLGKQGIRVAAEETVAEAIFFDAEEGILASLGGGLGENELYMEAKFKSALASLPINLGFEMAGESVGIIWRHMRFKQAEKKLADLQVLRPTAYTGGTPASLKEWNQEMDAANKELRDRAAKLQDSMLSFGYSMKNQSLRMSGVETNPRFILETREVKIERENQRIDDDWADGKIDGEEAGKRKQAVANKYKKEQTPETAAASSDGDEFGSLSTDDLKAEIEDGQKLVDDGVADDNTKARLERLKKELARREAGDTTATTTEIDDNGTDINKWSEGKLKSNIAELQKIIDAAPDSDQAAGVRQKLAELQAALERRQAQSKAETQKQGKEDGTEKKETKQESTEEDTNQPDTSESDGLRLAPGQKLVSLSGEQTTEVPVNAVAVGSWSGLPLMVRPQASWSNMPLLNRMARLSSAAFDVEDGTMPVFVATAGDQVARYRWYVDPEGRLSMVPADQQVISGPVRTSQTIQFDSEGMPVREPGKSFLSAEGDTFPQLGYKEGAVRGDQVLDKDGNPILDENGNPITVGVGLVDQQGNRLSGNIYFLQNSDGKVIDVAVQQEGRTEYVFTSGQESSIRQKGQELEALQGKRDRLAGENETAAKIVELRKKRNELAGKKTTAAAAETQPTPAPVERSPEFAGFDDEGLEDLISSMEVREMMGGLGALEAKKLNRAKAELKNRQSGTQAPEAAAGGELDAINQQITDLEADQNARRLADQLEDLDTQITQMRDGIQVEAKSVTVETVQPFTEEEAAIALKQLQNLEEEKKFLQAYPEREGRIVELRGQINKIKSNLREHNARGDSILKEYKNEADAVKKIEELEAKMKEAEAKYEKKRQEILNNIKTIEQDKELLPSSKKQRIEYQNQEGEKLARDYNEAIEEMSASLEEARLTKQNLDEWFTEKGYQRLGDQLSDGTIFDYDRVKERVRAIKQEYELDARARMQELGTQINNERFAIKNSIDRIAEIDKQIARLKVRLGEAGQSYHINVVRTVNETNEYVKYWFANPHLWFQQRIGVEHPHLVKAEEIRIEGDRLMSILKEGLSKEQLQANQEFIDKYGVSAWADFGLGILDVTYAPATIPAFIDQAGRTTINLGRGLLSVGLHVLGHGGAKFGAMELIGAGFGMFPGAAGDALQLLIGHIGGTGMASRGLQRGLEPLARGLQAAGRVRGLGGAGLRIGETGAVEWLIKKLPFEGAIDAIAGTAIEDFFDALARKVAPDSLIAAPNYSIYADYYRNTLPGWVRHRNATTEASGKIKALFLGSTAKARAYLVEGSGYHLLANNKTQGMAVRYLLHSAGTAHKALGIALDGLAGDLGRTLGYIEGPQGYQWQPLSDAYRAGGNIWSSDQGSFFDKLYVDGVAKREVITQWFQDIFSPGAVDHLGAAIDTMAGKELDEQLGRAKAVLERREKNLKQFDKQTIDGRYKATSVELAPEQTARARAEMQAEVDAAQAEVDGLIKQQRELKAQTEAEVEAQKKQEEAEKPTKKEEVKTSEASKKEADLESMTVDQLTAKLEEYKKLYDGAESQGEKDLINQQIVNINNEIQRRLPTDTQTVKQQEAAAETGKKAEQESGTPDPEATIEGAPVGDLLPDGMEVLGNMANSNAIQGIADKFRTIYQAAKTNADVAIKLFLQAHEANILTGDETTVNLAKIAAEALPAWARTAGAITAAMENFPLTLDNIRKAKAQPPNKKADMAHRALFKRVQRDWPILQKEVNLFLDVFDNVVAGQAMLELEIRIKGETPERLAQRTKYREDAKEIINAWSALREKMDAMAQEAAKENKFNAMVSMAQRFESLKRSVADTAKKVKRFMTGQSKQAAQEAQAAIDSIEQPKTKRGDDIVAKLREEEGTNQDALGRVEDALKKFREKLDPMRERSPLGAVIADAHEERFVLDMYYRIVTMESSKEEVMKGVLEGLQGKADQIGKALMGDYKPGEPGFKQTYREGILKFLNLEKHNYAKEFAETFDNMIDEDIRLMTEGKTDAATAFNYIDVGRYIQEIFTFLKRKDDKPYGVLVRVQRWVKSIKALIDEAKKGVRTTRTAGRNTAEALQDVELSTRPLDDSKENWVSRGWRVHNVAVKKLRKRMAKARLARQRQREATEARFMVEGQQDVAEYTQGANAANNEANQQLQAGDEVRTGTKKQELMNRRAEIRLKADAEARPLTPKENQELAEINTQLDEILRNETAAPAEPEAETTTTETAAEPEVVADEESIEISDVAPGSDVPDTTGPTPDATVSGTTDLSGSDTTVAVSGESSDPYRGYGGQQGGDVDVDGTGARPAETAATETPKPEAAEPEAGTPEQATDTSTQLPWREEIKKLQMQITRRQRREVYYKRAGASAEESVYDLEQRANEASAEELPKIEKERNRLRKVMELRDQRRKQDSLYLKEKLARINEIVREHPEEFLLSDNQLSDLKAELRKLDQDTSFSTEDEIYITNRQRTLGTEWRKKDPAAAKIERKVNLQRFEIDNQRNQLRQKIARHNVAKRELARRNAAKPEPADGGNGEVMAAATSTTGDARAKVQGDSTAVREDTQTKQGTEIPFAGPHEIGVLPLDDIKVNAKDFQFKQTFNPTGKVSQSDATQASTYNASLAGFLDVWKDKEGAIGPEGAVYVVNGHNRLTLAKDPNKGPVPETMNVRFLDAKNVKEARAYGAILNIADRNGTYIDAATFLRNMDISSPELMEMYASTENPLLAMALPLTRLSDDLFSAVVTGRIEKGHAFALGAREDLLPGTIDAIWRVAKEKKLNAGQTLELVMLADAKAPINSGVSRQQTIGGMESLFADVDLSEAEGMAKVSAFIKRKLKSLSDVLSKAGTTRGATTLESVEGNVIDQAQSAQDAERYGKLLENYKQLWTTTGPINAVVRNMARAITKKGKVGSMDAKVWDEFVSELERAIDEQSSLKPVDKDSLTTDTNQPNIAEDTEAVQTGASTEGDGKITQDVDDSNNEAILPGSNTRLVNNNVDQPTAKADDKPETAEAAPEAAEPEPTPEPTPEPKIKLAPGQRIKRRADIPNLTDDQLAEQIPLWAEHKDKLNPGIGRTAAENTYKALLKEQEARQAKGQTESDAAPAATPAPASAPAQTKAKPKAQGQTKPKRVTKTTDLTQLSEAEIDEQLVLLRAYADAPNITARTRASREDLYAKVARQKELWGIKNTSREELPALIESLDAARKTEGLSDADKAIREEDYRTAYDEQLDRRNGTSTRGGVAETRTVMWKGKPTKLEKQPGLPIGVTVVNEANDKLVKLFDINSNNEVRDVITYRVDRSKIQNAKVLNEIDEYLSTAMRYDPDSTERLDRIKAARQAFIELLPPDERPSGGGGVQMFAGLPVSPELLNSLPTLSKWDLQSLPLRFRIEMAMLFQSMDEIGGWAQSTLGTKIAPAVAQQLRRLAPNTLDINVMAFIRNTARRIDNALAEVRQGISQMLGQELQLAMAADASSIDQLRSPTNPVWDALEPEQGQALGKMLSEEQQLTRQGQKVVAVGKGMKDRAMLQEAIPPQPDDESLDLLDNFLDDTMGIMPPGSGDELISQKREGLLAEREVLESAFPDATTPKQRQELRNQIDAVEYQMDELDRVEWQNGQQRKIAGIPVYNIQKLLRQARRVGFNALHPELQRGLHSLIAQVRDVAHRTSRQFDVEDQYQALEESVEPTPAQEVQEAAGRFADLFLKHKVDLLVGNISANDLMKKTMPNLLSSRGKPLMSGNNTDLIASAAALTEVFQAQFAKTTERYTDAEFEEMVMDLFKDNALDAAQVTKNLKPIISKLSIANQAKVASARLVANQYAIASAQAAGRYLSLNPATTPDDELVRSATLLFDMMDGQRKASTAYNTVMSRTGQLLRTAGMKFKQGEETVDLLRMFKEEVEKEGEQGLMQTLGQNISPELQDAMKSVAEGDPAAAKKLRMPKVKEEVDQLALFARSLEVEPGASDSVWKRIREGAAMGGEGLLLLRYSSLLSSGATFWVNLVGTGLRVVTQPIPQVLGAAISGDAKGMAMGAMHYVATIKSLSDAWRLASHSFKLGVGLWDPASMSVESFDRLARKVQKSGKNQIAVQPERWGLNRGPYDNMLFNSILKTVTLPIRTLNATDTFWKALAGNSNHWVRRYAEALEVTGGNIAEASEMATKRLEADMADVVLYPDEPSRRTVVPRAAMMNQHALNYARQASFTDSIMAMPERRTQETAQRVARRQGIDTTTPEGRKFVEDYMSKNDGKTFDPVFLGHTRLVSGIPQMLNQMKASQSPFSPLLDIVVPFIKTPTDIIKSALRYSPAAVFVDTWMRDVLSQDAMTRQRAIGEVATGSIAGLGLWLYTAMNDPDEATRAKLLNNLAMGSAGLGILANHMVVSRENVEFTGGGPLGFKAKNKWMEQGQKRPNSYRIRQDDGSWGPWRSHRAYEPWSTIIGVMADYTESVEGMTDEQRAQAGAIISTGLAAKLGIAARRGGSIAGGLANKTWLQGLEELFSMFEDMNAHGLMPQGRRDPVARFLQRQAVTFMPYSSALRRSARDRNPQLGKVDASDFLQETWDEFRKAVLGGGVPLLNTITGEPIVIGGAIGRKQMDVPSSGWNMIRKSVKQFGPGVVIEPWQAEDDPVMAEMFRLRGPGTDFTVPQRRMFGNGAAEMTAQEWNAYVTLRTQTPNPMYGNRTLHEQLQRMIESEAYQNLPPEVPTDMVPSFRAGAINKVISSYDELAKSLFLAKSFEPGNRIRLNLEKFGLIEHKQKVRSTMGNKDSASSARLTKELRQLIRSVYE